jgi:pyrimidine-specific ribonucleoside hydrolase
MMKVIWDMETSDPDDFLTLLLLLGHPCVRLQAVTVTPGTPEQIGLVRYALNQFGRDIPVGAYNIEHGKKCVSGWHYYAYGQIPPSLEAEDGPELLLRLCDEQTTLITGGPLHNLGRCLRLAQERNVHAFRLGRLVAQGGFAGEGIVPEEKQLGKFKGRRTCPTFNLNGAPHAATAVLASFSIRKRVFVSKNVCHRVLYDQSLHASFQETKDACLSHALIWQGMDHYLRRHPGGKLLHDPLAACCAIDERIGTWAEVELYSQQGEWGARLSPDSHTWIITDYDHEHFLKILTMY